ncbi:MAG: DUF3566 domain-containing protein [Ilumatobacteraceae bacterium]
MDSGVPPTSKRAGSRTGSGGSAKTGGAKSANAKANGAKANGVVKSAGSGSARQGPVDPRTEDSSSPRGVARAVKTVWRRPGALTPRTAKHRETGSLDAPIDFSVALPLAPDMPVAKTADSPRDASKETQPIALAPTIEVLAPPPPPTEVVPVTSPQPAAFMPTAPAPTVLPPTGLAPTALAAAMLVPTELVPTDLAPSELAPPEAPVLQRTPILYDEAATTDDVTKIGPILSTRPLRRPVHFRRAPKPRIRRVTRVVRHVDTWSVFKVALVFNVFFYAVALLAGVLLWQVAYATGTIDNVEKFFEGFGWETFNFNGGQIFHNAWIAGLFVAVGLTGLAVLLATLFNLITDLVGGIRLSVLEEEVQTRAERGIEQVPLDDASAAVDENDALVAQEFIVQAPESPDEATAG